MSFKCFSFFSSGGHFVQWSGIGLVISVEGPKEHFCENILKSGHWSRRRCHFKVLFSGAVVVEGHPRNISVKLF